MSSAPGDTAAPAPAARHHAVVAVEIGAALVIVGGFAWMAVESYEQIARLIWRPAELTRMGSALVSLATTFPLRFVFLVLGSVAAMLAAEYRPRAVIRVSTAAWVSLGVAGTGAYLLSAFGAGSRWAFAVLVGAGAVAAGVILSRRSNPKPLVAGPVRGPDVPSRSRPLLPVAVGLVGGLLAVRASVEPVTEWDAVIYHVSFARDWIDSLPGLPHAAGPSVGAELSYNYPALFPSVSVVLAGALHLGVGAVARLMSPIAAVTVLAVLRAVRQPSSLFVGWAGPMFLLGSAFFVAYGQWPTAYMLMTVLIVLAVARLVSEGRLTPATALCIGLAAETGLIGVVFGSIVVVGYFSVRLGQHLSAAPARRVLALPRATSIAVVSVLLVAPLGAVGIASLRRTGGLLFPWVTWPNAGHLLPEPYWKSAKREILANAYGQFDASVGSFFAPLRGISTSGLLAPGGLALAGVIVVACAIGRPRSRRVLLLGVGLLAGSLVFLVAAEVIWLRYFLPLCIGAAALLGLVVETLRQGSPPEAFPLVERTTRLAYLAAAVAAATAVASGAAYALAGPNDRTFTAATGYATARASAFESARALDSRTRREVVFGDDSRAWDDINRLEAGGVAVGTFDIRNYYSHYVPRLQLDGRSGAAIAGTTSLAVARRLKEKGIEAVFVPSWFWEPGAGRDPLADRSPVALWVGSPPLRALRVYLPDEYATQPSVLYVVARSSAERARVARMITTPSFSIEGPLSSRRTTIRGGFSISGLLGGTLHWRLAAPVTENGGPTIRLTTRNVGAARGVAVFEPRLPTLVQSATFVDCTSVARWARESTVDITLPGSPLGFSYLDIGVPQRVRRFRSGVRQRPDTANQILVRACGDPAGPRGGVFPGRSTATRIIMEHRGPHPVALSFDYLDAGRRAVSFNLYDAVHDRWVYDVADVVRCGSGRWVHAQLPMDELPRGLAGTGTIELSPVVNGANFAVRNLRVLEGRARHRQGGELGRHGPQAGCSTTAGSAARG